MAEYIAAGIQMQQYAHRDDSVMFRDDMEEVFSRSPVETYTECLALSLFIDKQAGTLNLRMSHNNPHKNATRRWLALDLIIHLAFTRCVVFAS